MTRRPAWMSLVLPARFRGLPATVALFATLGVVATLGLGVTLAVTTVRSHAARAKGQIDVSFGSLSVDAGTNAQFLLVLRNSGSGDATFSLADRIDLRFTTGGGSTDLTTEGGPLSSSSAAAPLPAGIVESSNGTEPDRSGTTFVFQGPLTLAPGAALVLELAGTTTVAGIAPVAVELVLGKTAGNYPRRTEFRVVKSRPQSDYFFGDGSDGDLVIAADAALEPLRSYANVRIAAGVTVTVPSGATLRLTGDFENRGTIVVGPGGAGGGVLVDQPEGAGAYALERELYPPSTDAGKGDAATTPGRPGVASVQAVSGALGGRGIDRAVYALPLSHYRLGGGGGSGAFGAVGGAGGGLLRVIARGEIRNGGSIVAAGLPASVNRTGNAAGGGAGGGGGGIVIFASALRVSNDVPANANGAASSGVIDVRGGNASPFDARGGQGGGGGGGLVVFVAPEVLVFGTTRLEGGLSNAATTTLPPEIGVWAGGGGGGACVGHGGDGAGVTSQGGINLLPAVPALPTAGQVIVRTADPRGLW